ncbi:hypothetical protein WG68_07840 [Arsukibacterium ikkense]|uniref:NADPH--hemoprotein reductase n=1 Tax=Arsukibacterium ikkense TaxID=336831 RepID=A0A0M2V5T8_9GAMM|nr:hypothetical protein WG68_07840 [Arsukibacterium ikkense]
MLLCTVLYLNSASVQQRFDALLAAGSVVSSLLLICRGWLSSQQQSADNPPTELTSPQPPWLIGYASQTGYAEQLARQTARQFNACGIACSLRSLNELNPAMLGQYSGALLVVSTYGEGEAPDNALQFQQQASGWQQALPQLPFAILALGDRSYQQFCGFGHWLHQWFCQRQARALQAVTELDSQRNSNGALQQWHQLLASITGQQPTDTTASTELILPEQTRWLPSKLISRYLANPGSQGAPCYVIKLAVEPDSQWQAGDIVAVQPQNSKCDVALWLTRHQLYGCQQVHYLGQPMPLCCALAKLALSGVTPPAQGEALEPWLARQPQLPLRHYSIASIPSEGQLTLLVRQASHADGTLGIGSGWLTSWLSEQQPFQLQLRRHSHFQLPADDRPLLFIANGTGIAGIRALLAERIARKQANNWLIFGERSQQTDFFFARDIQRWQQQGFIGRCQLVFSRDQAAKRYVQHCLAEQATAVRELVDAGGAIYVCGSLLGMGSAVHSVLTDILGSSPLNVLQQQGRYRRDLY